MAEPLVVRDLSPFGELAPGDEQWLTLLQRHIRVSDHLIRLGETEDAEEDFVVRRDPYGRWQAGRYIGEIAWEGRRLEIRPRLGELVIEQWLGKALNLIAVPETSARQRSESFLARLMGVVWCRSLAQASRHGPPAIRREFRQEGIYIRGRLDVERTAELRGAGSPHLASVLSRRDLDNDVSRTLVAAERVLTQRIGHDQWRTPRVKEVLPHLQEAVGVRPRLPRRRDLQRIRYTPITRPFKALADFSWRIAQLEGFSASSEHGRAEGLLLDVAELWELFVLGCIRRAAPELGVEHGTVASESTFLMHSDTDPELGLGRIKPDVLVFDGERPVAVADAKYKRLLDVWPERPRGVDRADLYQLASYLSRFAPTGRATGMLLYPQDPEQSTPATAETQGPWRTEAGNEVRFERLPLKPEEAISALRLLLRQREATL
jgi:5-methylcytosine-specific restriction enzyme subunit McrC